MNSFLLCQLASQAEGLQSRWELCRCTSKVSIAVPMRKETERGFRDLAGFLLLRELVLLLTTVPQALTHNSCHLKYPETSIFTQAPSVSSQCKLI